MGFAIIILLGKASLLGSLLQRGDTWEVDWIKRSLPGRAGKEGEEVKIY